MHVYMMSIISFERYYVLKDPSNMKKINKKTVYTAIIVSLILSLFWSIMPLIGWSKYTLEDALTACSIEWKKRNLNVISYNISIFIFVFLLPFTFIFVTNFKSYLIVSYKFKLNESLQYYYIFSFNLDKKNEIRIYKL